MQVLGIGLQAQAYMSSVAELYTWPESLAFKEHGVTGSFGLSIFFIFPTWEEDDRKRARKTASQETERNREGLRVPAG